MSTGNAKLRGMQKRVNDPSPASTLSRYFLGKYTCYARKTCRHQVLQTFPRESAYYLHSAGGPIYPDDITGVHGLYDTPDTNNRRNSYCVSIS